MDREKLEHCLLYEFPPRRRAGESLKSILQKICCKVTSLTEPSEPLRQAAIANINIGVIHFPPVSTDINEAITTPLKTHPHIPWIVLGRHKELSESGVHKGARNNVTFIASDNLAPGQLESHLLASIQNLCQKKSHIASQSSSMSIDGADPAIKQLRRKIIKMASTLTPVLICGETGTGKEMAARSIHNLSLRKDNAFIPINCGAIPPTLIHSELFGHENGAFTGANKRHIGLFERAHGGTVFLDEVAELPLELQASLLRFLQEKTICRVGGEQTIRVDARIIAATHVNLRDAISKGIFREDLYYRLAVLQVDMPPLRERNQDIFTLADIFLRQYCEEHNLPPICFSAEAISTMRQHDWPGNIRELMNCVHRAAVMSENKVIDAPDLGIQLSSHREKENLFRFVLAQSAEDSDLEQTKLRAEKISLLNALESCSHNITKACKQLGISRTSMYRLLKKHDLSRPEQTS